MPWDTTIELLAKTVEEVSRLARENPIEIQRPWVKEGEAEPGTGQSSPGRKERATPPPSPAAQAGIHRSPDGAVVVNGMEAMIQFAAGQGHTVRSEHGE